MLIHPFLRRFVVVRNNSKTSSKTTKFRYFFDKLNRVTRIISTYTRNQRNASIDNLLYSRKQLQLLIVGQSWTLSSRSCEKNSIRMMGQ
ncbi:Uncharacterised protein [Mycobacterium tuberculosis]|nr:Uncharacterised protein [Mycobacterium tuberculosis]